MTDRFCQLSFTPLRMFQPHRPESTAIYDPLFFHRDLLVWFFLHRNTPKVGVGHDVGKHLWVSMWVNNTEFAKDSSAVCEGNAWIKFSSMMADMYSGSSGST
jgi:hypothetical protein